MAEAGSIDLRDVFECENRDYLMFLSVVVDGVTEARREAQKER